MANRATSTPVPNATASRMPVVSLAATLVVPIGGLALLLARPSLNGIWEHHPSHFWLVLGVALVNVVLAAVTSEAAAQKNDARLFLVSLALLSSAGFLGLHALATPGVLLTKPNRGFLIATPVGPVVASVFAMASTLPREAGSTRLGPPSAAHDPGRPRRADRGVGDRVVRGRGVARSCSRRGDADGPACPVRLRHRAVCVRRVALPARARGIGTSAR